MNAFMYAKALESIEEFGFVDPLTLRPMGSRYQIVDGEHRLNAGTESGMTEFPAFIVSGLSDAQAKKLTLVMNELRGQARPDLLQELLRDLDDDLGIDALKVALPYPDEVLAGFLGAELPPLQPLDQPKSQGDPKEKWVERVYRMPQSAADVLDEAINKAKNGDPVEDWQALEYIAGDYLAS